MRACRNETPCLIWMKFGGVVGISDEPCVQILVICGDRFGQH